MRPVIRALFVLSFFGILAMHVSTGLLRDMTEESAPWLLSLVDGFLRTMLIEPLGRDVTILGLWAAGGVLALVAFIYTPATKGGEGEKRSTW